MAIVKTNVLAGDDAGNGVDDSFVLELLWGATPALSVDGHTLTYPFPDGDVKFESTAGFTAP